ncbi:glycosyltransferase family 4 protein, partial [Akkermansiaceae bacterium]|nr:glycosyltransferase family 4 protein [Akkermansiaceae bacterium]
RAIRHQLGIPNKAPIILFVGSGWKRKGAEALVSAFKNLNNPNAHLVLVGKGRLKQSAAPRIHLTGPVKDPRKHYFAADLFALPTLYDPFSNACLEAAAFRLPVLTTDGNGFAEALAQFPGAGEIIPNPRTPEAWTKALDSWLSNEISQEALEKLIAFHTMDLNISKTVDLLSSLAQDHPQQ